MSILPPEYGDAVFVRFLIAMFVLEERTGKQGRLVPDD